LILLRCSICFFLLILSTGLSSQNLGYEAIDYRSVDRPQNVTIVDEGILVVTRGGIHAYLKLFKNNGEVQELLKIARHPIGRYRNEDGSIDFIFMGDIPSVDYLGGPEINGFSIVNYFEGQISLRTEIFTLFKS